MRVMHYFSISIKLIQLLELPSAFKMAKLVFKHVFLYFGIPEDIMSDQGLQFTSIVWSNFLKKL